MNDLFFRLDLFGSSSSTPDGNQRSHCSIFFALAILQRKYLEAKIKNEVNQRRRIKHGRRNNKKVSIQKDGVLLEGVDEIKREVKRVYEEIFRVRRCNRPVLDELTANQLEANDVMALEKEFTMEEIKEVRWNCDRNKILVKLLAARIKDVLGKLISKCQTTFVSLRHIFNGVVVVNEIIDLSKRRKE